MRVKLLAAGLIGLSLSTPAARAQEQQSPASQQQPPDKPQPQQAPEDKTPPKPKQDAGQAAPQAPANTNYDPFHAAQDMDVGMFYMHKGDMDAAIERFRDAIRLKPSFAKPRLLLGEIYEKKGDTQEAIRYYKEFLEIMPPGSPDTKKVQKKIEKLTAK